MLEPREGVLSQERLLGLVEACGFSALETVQMVEYLWSRGFDIPEIHPSESECQTVTGKYEVERDALDDWDTCCPVFEYWYED